MIAEWHIAGFRKALTIDGRIVRIHDWALLRAIGDFDPSYLQLQQPKQAAA